MGLEEVVYSCVDHALHLLLLAYHRLTLTHRMHPRHLVEVVPLHPWSHLSHLSHLTHVPLTHRPHLVTRIHRMQVAYFLNLLVEPTRVVSFGPGHKLPKGIVNDVVVVEELLLLTLVGSAHLVEFPDVFVFHLLHHREVSTLTRRIFQVHICEVGEVDVHFADGSQQLSPIQGSLCLHFGRYTC